jgi:hypothetical protein
MAHSPEKHVLRHGDRSEAARKLQAATNRRLRSRGLEALTLEEDGVVGLRTLAAVRKVAWALGARSETYESITRDGVIPVGVQLMILNPGRRTDQQKSRGKARMSRMRSKRKQAQRQHKSARSRAVHAFLAKVGTRENPAGSNGGGIISVMEAYFGFGRVPWCGISAGYHAERFGGMDLASDVASVAAIERHARAGHKPYGRWQSNVRGALPGSFVVIGGFGVHVGMLVQALPDGSARTVEGNTSFGPHGSQSNGGCIAARTRSPREIHGVASMDYPG